MRFHYLLLSLAGAVVGSAQAKSEETVSVPSTTRSAEPLTTSVTRSLRINAHEHDKERVSTASVHEEYEESSADATVNEDDEERNLSSFAEVFSKINPFKRGVTDDYLMKLVKKKKPSEAIMKAIRLDKAGDKLFEDSNFKNLVRYAKHASPQHPEKAMIRC
ncbi:unnamed protein product [Peronospora belbahrii]|uniref:RxLR effector protein n=1 Tax=Peronospora belbahrii TaxID=622444 RepID=A0ABN8CQ68_9STRA|nr:unnamed protein product [Peronospora belbahrii]